jgi:hypothetical protein
VDACDAARRIALSTNSARDADALRRRRQPRHVHAIRANMGVVHGLPRRDPDPAVPRSLTGGPHRRHRDPRTHRALGRRHPIVRARRPARRAECHVGVGDWRVDASGGLCGRLDRWRFGWPCATRGRCLASGVAGPSGGCSEGCRGFPARAGPPPTQLTGCSVSACCHSMQLIGQARPRRTRVMLRVYRPHKPTAQRGRRRDVAAQPAPDRSRRRASPRRSSRRARPDRRGF